LVVTDRHQASRPLTDIVTEVFIAGCAWVSVREKDMPAGQQLALCRALLPTARQFGAALTLHGDPALAAAVGLDGAHLPEAGDAKAARALLPRPARIGLSVHSAAQAAAADPAQVDYLIAGPMFATASKPGYGPTLGAAGLSRLVAVSRVPVYAIGGIELATVRVVLDAGAAGVAVMGGVMRAEAPGRAVGALLDAVSEARRRQRPR
jgi:thiamine-phosphate pyrophosphorylase